MKVVLDTNVVSALMKGDAAVVARLRSLPRSDVLLPQPVIAEIAYGLERLPASKRKLRLRQRFDRIRRELQRTAWTDDVSAAFGQIKSFLEKSGRRIEDFDVAIAAHAVAEDAVLVTTDRQHMNRVPNLQTESWATRRD